MVLLSKWRWWVCFLIIQIIIPIVFCSYQVGVGRGDCTGPAAEINFMGYARLTQKGCGLHSRQFARAFIFDDHSTRIVYVSIDACMVGFSLKNAVIQKLKELYNATYTHENVILSGTHTHGTPGGFLVDVLYDITILGFSQETFDAYTTGIVNAIKRAHENMAESRIYFTAGEVDANINRSPASYLLNPEGERNKYDHDTDKNLTQLKIVRTSDNSTAGVINWYAVHAVSLNYSNCLVTSDNVGYASVLLESLYNKDNVVGQGSFVGAFVSSNLGDVSPNMNGSFCIDTGDRCDFRTSTCNGKNELCVAKGPGSNMYESAEIIAGRLYNKSLVRGCLPAMGYSFAAGTTDGTGAFDFTQATTTDNPFWNIIRDFVFPPTPDDIDCHYPKPILLNTGRIQVPYSWQPHIVATQIVLLGNFAIIAVPGEFTTMSGRRMRDMVKKTLISSGANSSTEIVLAGLSNTYTSYIATYEEYQLQRYEGASTIFGPHTLTIYLSHYKYLAESIMKNIEIDGGPIPDDPDKRKLMSLIAPVFFDSAGWFSNFGDVIQQPDKTAKKGETVSAKFISGNPRNNLMLEKTFLTIEMQAKEGDWRVIATDGNFETRFIWRRTSVIKARSEVDIQWDIKDNIQAGIYRIRHFGYYKSIFGGIYPYEGITNNFYVTANSPPSGYNVNKKLS